VFHRNFDDPTAIYSGEFTAEDINSWISRQKVPTLGEISAETYTAYVASGLPIGYLFIDPSADNTNVLSSLKEVVNKVKDRLSVAWIDNGKYAQHAVRIGLSGKTVPSFAVDDSTKGTRYIFPEDVTFSVEELAKWIERYLADEIPNHIKSEAIPEDNNGPVKTIVAHTFESIVKDPTKDVLVEFYAPWCGHCKKLVPIWEELGEHFKTSPNVVIAKIDATANDVPPQLNIKGFPTILFFPAADKNPVEYQGSRDLEDLKSFVLKQTGAEDEGEDDDEEEGTDHTHDEL